MQSRLERMVAQLGEPDVTNEPEHARKIRLATQAIVRDYAEFVEAFECEWIAKQVDEHLAELRKDKHEYFRHRREEIRMARRRGLRIIIATRDWWNSWKPIWWAFRVGAACLAVYLVTVGIAPMANGAGQSLESRCVRRLLTVMSSP